MAQTNEKGTTSPKKTGKKKKKKNRAGRIILTVLLLLLIGAAAVFIYYLGRTVYVSYIRGNDEEADIGDITSITYETTPLSLSSKVGYYLVGVMGEEGSEGPLEMLSLVCFDKQAKSLRILQMPTATYLGSDSHFKVKKLGEVFANPQDFLWCETCRRRVYEPEIGAEGTHTVCGEALTYKTGSATVNLAEVFNYQYGLPVDGYFIFEQPTFYKLVDLLDGVKVDLAFDVKTEGAVYKKGVRLIDGKTALQYVAAENGKVQGDIDRMARFQQVFTAVMQRLFVLPEEKLTADVFQPLMGGSTPIRVAVGDTYKTVVELVKQLREVPFTKMTAYLVPGEEASSEGTAYWSVHAADLLALLQAEFNPYGDPITQGDLQIAELSNARESDLMETSLSQWTVDQAGEPTAAPTEGN